MGLQRSDIKNIAWLARLAVSEDEISGYQQELDPIFGLVAQMQSVNTDSLAPLAHPLDMHARLRPDAITESNQRDKYQQIAPDVDKGYYLVPRVIE
jgi:aspartyl-tRNA(Asn)/glutamyl-tRNA(Gln) amidotransferase subunit C